MLPVGFEGFEAHVLEDVEERVEAERPGRLGVVARLIEGRPGDADPEVLEPAARRTAEDAGRTGGHAGRVGERSVVLRIETPPRRGVGQDAVPQDRRVRRVDAVRAPRRAGRVVRIDAVPPLAPIEVEGVRVREDERHLDVQAHVPEDAEVRAQVEDVSRPRVLEILDDLRLGRERRLRLPLDEPALRLVQPPQGQVEVEAVVVLQRRDDPGDLRRPPGAPEQHQRGDDRPTHLLEGAGAQGCGDDNTTTARPPPLYPPVRSPSSFIFVCRLLRVIFELAGGLRHVAAGLVERALDQLALDPLGLGAHHLLERARGRPRPLLAGRTHRRERRGRPRRRRMGAPTTSGGRSETWMSGPSQNRMVRSITFSSSRMLPGQA